MQKLINVIALLSGLTSLAVIGGSVYVVMNQDAWRAQAQLELQNLVVRYARCSSWIIGRCCT